MDTPEYADSLIDLQIRCTHQEDQIQALVLQVQSQQAEIERMQLQLKWLADNLRQMKSNPGASSESEELPPHY